MAEAPQLAHSAFVKELAHAVGVGVSEVAKVLEHLGVARIHDQVVRLAGKEPSVNDVRAVFKVGGNLLVAT
jgi:hypothetical protein